MMIVLSNVLEAEDVARVRRELERAQWRDGRATAGPAAREVKRNLQARNVAALAEFVEEALQRHPTFEIAARPKRLSRIMFSRYEPGMSYGPHTDDAMMGRAGERLRADLAFTLFLSDPSDYEGGALTIATSGAEQAVRLEAGSAILYPAGTIHHVAPVVRGERLAAVGWVQSLVRDATAREILFDLSVARGRLGPLAARQDVLLLDKAIPNLLRMWGEA
jgi:PKHD-type hydroxylase